MAALQILVVVYLVSVTYAQIPIPKREVGFVYKHGRDDAPIHLDVFLDIICPDSKEAFPALLAVADFYGPNQLQFKAHYFPLPYHRTAYMATRGLHVIDGLSNGTKTFEWMSLMFNNMDSLVNSATNRFSEDEMVSKFVDYATGMGIDSVKFQAGILDSTIEWDTRVAWKYACTRGVAATPTYMVNGVVSTDIKQQWTVDQWKNFIGPILQPAASTFPVTSPVASTVASTNSASPTLVQKSGVCLSFNMAYLFFRMLSS